MSSRRHSSQTEVLLPILPELHHLLEKEKELWHSNGARIDEIPKHALREEDVGSLLLSHGNTVKDVHLYFRKLDFCHRFSGKLGHRKSLNDIRVVHSDGRDIGIEEGAGPIAVATAQTRPIRPTTSLTQKEFQLFRQTVLCAFFPVLSVPCPPSPISPTPFHQPFPAHPAASSAGLTNQVGGGGGANFSDSDQVTGVVQSEALCAKVREIFGLSREKFEYYTERVADELGRKTAAKLLAEELSSQLCLLENNTHPYYSPKAFVSRNAYDTWHHWERSQVTDLINKFWHFSLPPPLLHMARKEFCQSHHQNYCFLLVRIMRCESNKIKNMEQSTEFLLSSTSLRLLKEFGLRNGVGELFRRIVYLEYIANHFLSSVKYVQHATLTVKKLTEVLPVDQGHKIMVKQEVDILQSTLSLLQGQCSNLLTQMQTLFPNNKPPDGIESLIELLSSVLELKSLLNNRKKVGSVGYWLKQYMQENFQKTYSSYLKILRTQMETKNNVLTPSLLSSLAISLMDEVSCFEQYFDALFSNYFHLSALAAKSFYSFLMEDVNILCQQVDETTLRSVDRTMLRLALRLNQLDQKWCHYMTIKDQKWRLLFFDKARLWIEVIKEEMVNLLRISIGKDKYSTLTFPDKAHFEDSWKKSKKPQKIGILTPSNNSAFNSLISSLSSSPLPNDEVHMILAGDAEKVRAAVPAKCESSSFPRISHIGYSLRQGLLKSLELECRQCEKTGKSRSRSDSALYYPSPPAATSFSQPDSHLPLAGQAPAADHSCASASPPTQRPTTTTTTVEEQNGTSAHSRAALDSDRTEIGPTEKDRNTGGGDTSLLFQPIRSKQRNADTSGFSSDSEVCVSKRRQQRLGLSSGHENYPFFINDDVFSTDTNDNLNRSVIAVENGVAPNSDPVKDQQKKSKKLGDKVGHLTWTNSESDMSRSSVSGQTSGHPPNTSQLSSQSSVAMFLSSNVFSPAGETNDPPSMESGGSAADSHPHRPPRTYPVSGSLVDLVTMLNRLLEFGHDLCQVLCWQGGSHRASPSSDPNSQDIHHTDIDKMKISLYQHVLQVVSHVACLYADSMMFIDMCATPATRAAQMLGEQLVSQVMEEAASKLVWVCRHMLSKQNCNLYVSKKATLLCDRFEPVTQQMCTRINNVSSLLSLLPVIHGKLLKVLKLEQVDYDNPYCLDESLNEYFVVNDLVPSLNEIMTPQDTNDWMPSHCYSHYMSVTDVVRGQCADHLQQVLNGMLHLIAYKTNLFFGEGLGLLMEVDLSSQVAEKRFRPLTDFLVSHVSAFQEWLYPNNSLQQVQTLWSHIIQAIKHEANNLQRFRSNSGYSASLLLQAVGLFIECVYNKEKTRLDLDNLVQPTEDLLYLIQLYTLSSAKLVLLYHQMESQAAEASDQPHDRHPHLQLPPQHTLSCMCHDLHSVRKCFSGQQLVQWILSNYLCSEEINSSNDMKNCLVDRAVWIGQKMIDTGVICELVDGLNNLNDSSSSISTRPVYPKLTLYSHLSPSIGQQQQAASSQTPSTLSQSSFDADDDHASGKDCPSLEKHSSSASEEDDSLGQCDGGEKGHSLLGGSIPNLDTSTMDLRRLAIHKQMYHVADSPSFSSMASEDSFQGQPSFFNSQTHFYYFVDLDTTTSPNHSASNSMDWGRSKVTFNHHPVSSEHLLTILYSRKRKDRVAAQFIQHVSDEILQRIGGSASSRTASLFTCFL